MSSDSKKETVDLSDISQVECLLLHGVALVRPDQAFWTRCAVYLHLTHDLIAISGLDGGVDPDFGPINIRMDRPIEPFSLSYCH